MIFLKIVKYSKQSSSKYKLELDDGRKLVLYEDVILKYQLLLKKEIIDSEISNIENDNYEWDVYYTALNSIKSRVKSVYGLKESLLKKEYPIELVDKACSKLIEQGYLDDRSFAKSYINNQIITTNNGPNKIKRELIKHKVSLDIICDELGVFDEDTQLEKIRKVATRLFKSNKSRGGAVLRNKIVNDLVNLGYEANLVYKVVDEFDYSNDRNIAAKEYDKLYKRLSRKYEGKELEYKIKEKLYQKGLYYEN